MNDSSAQSMTLGVIVERRKLDNPWREWSWRPVAVIPGAGPVSQWRELRSGDGWTQFHAATLPLELHRKETEGYLVNLANEPPVIYVVLREDEEDATPDMPMSVHLVTASPFEAQDYLDSGEELVEPVAMPDDLVAWVQGFCDAHHVEQPFLKRKRDRVRIKDEKFGQEPLVDVRRRMADSRSDADGG